MAILVCINAYFVAKIEDFKLGLNLEIIGDAIERSSGVKHSQSFDNGSFLNGSTALKVPSLFVCSTAAIGFICGFLASNFFEGSK